MNNFDLIEKIRKDLNDELNKRFSVKLYKPFSEEELSEIELNVQGGKIGLSIFCPDKDNTCIIQYSLYWSAEDGESILTELYQLCIMLKELFLVTRQLPCIDIYVRSDIGSKEDISINLEYVLEDYTIEAILYIIEAFNRVDLRKGEIDKCFLKKYYEELYEILIRKSNESREKFKQIAESNIQQEIYDANISILKPTISNIFSKADYVYSDYRQKIYIGFTQEGLDNYINQHQIEFREFSDYYEGINYNIMSVPETTYVWEKKLWTEAWNWLYTLEMNYGEVPVYKAYGKGRILLRVIEFWVCIMTEVDIKEKIIFEKKCLQKMQKKYVDNVINEISELEYDFSKLSPGEFEEMCCDLLCAEGYKNVQRRGRLNAPDGGVDIEAVEVVKGIVGDEEKKWIFQCKRTSQNIDRKELAEIPFLLDEFGADRYGLFTTGTLTPSALNRCKNFEKNSFNIFDENVIKQKLREYSDVANKYFPLYNISVGI